MSWDQSVITSVSYKTSKGQLTANWTSTAPKGQWYQVYAGGQLQKTTQNLSATFPAPSTAMRIDVGAIASADRQSRFNDTLAVSPANRAELSWIGGQFEESFGGTISGFFVFAATPPTGYGVGGYGSGGYGATGGSAGGYGSGGYGVGGYGATGGYGAGGYGAGGYGIGGAELNLTPLATIPAYTGGVITAGYGMGGYGMGGYGNASASYSWTSGPLAGGTWMFAIAPYDTAGNIGSIQTASVEILAPPLPPSRFSDDLRLHYTVTPAGGGDSVIELFWNPSPSEL